MLLAQVTTILIGAVVGVWFEFEVNYVGSWVVNCDCYGLLGDSNKGEFPTVYIVCKGEINYSVSLGCPNGETTCEAFLVIEPPCGQSTCESSGMTLTCE